MEIREVDTLQELFRYHGWATATLIDFCSTLSSERLHTSMPGTFGPVLPTLVHLVGADQGYLRHVTGELPEPPLRAGTERLLAELRSRIETQTRRWLALLDRRGELDVTLTLPAEANWPPVPHAQHPLFLQPIHHGSYIERLSPLLNESGGYDGHLSHGLGTLISTVLVQAPGSGIGSPSSTSASK